MSEWLMIEITCEMSLKPGKSNRPQGRQGTTAVEIAGAAGASYAGNWIDKIVFARPRWKRGQRGSLYGSKRSNSLFTTP